MFGFAANGETSSPPLAIWLAMEDALSLFGFLSAASSSSVFSQRGLFAADAADDFIPPPTFFVLAGRAAVWLADGGGVTAFAQEGTLEAAAMSPLGASLAATASLAIISRSR